MTYGSHITCKKQVKKDDLVPERQDMLRNCLGDDEEVKSVEEWRMVGKRKGETRRQKLLLGEDVFLSNFRQFKGRTLFPDYGHVYSVLMKYVSAKRSGISTGVLSPTLNARRLWIFFKVGTKRQSSSFSVP